MKVLIISDGNSSERKISLISAKAVREALAKAGIAADIFDYKKGQESLKKILKKYDVAFPVMHGEEGEGGELQKFLSEQKVPFVGGDWKGFKKAWYKIPFKKYCTKEHIPTAQWKIIKTDSPAGRAGSTLYALNDIKKFGLPCVVKSDNGGSSREVILLRTEADLKSSQLKKLLNSGDKLYVERLIDGIEVTVGILDDQALPILEIVPPKGKWFDYQNKYSGATKEIPFAPSVDKRMQEIVQKLALELHQHFKLGHYSRTDFIISKGMPYVLEINTIPGLTPESLFPKAAKAAGLDFPELVKKLVYLTMNN